jgi:DNA helicase-2/ATP-dependent DNA helicase PcrA
VEAMMLNKEQQEAVLSKDRFIFLYAGAGTGKTTVMIHRMKQLLNEGIDPKKILALTFTHIASLHMQSKLDHDDVELKTFHAWAYHFIQKPIISDTIPFSKNYITKVSHYKNKHIKKTLPWYLKTYETYLNKNQVIDYDDVLIEAILENGFNKVYDYILIDEFQDTNPLQLKLLSILIKKHTHVFAVGDPDQSIYKFRGAVPNIVNIFIHQYKAKTYILHTNYRSDQKIIHLSNHILSFNKARFKKTLSSSSMHEGEIHILKFFNTFKEAQSLFHLLYTLKGSTLIIARTHERLYEIKMSFFYEYHSYHKEQIDIMTIHQAKGLEYDNVILLGLEQGVLPLGKYLDQETLEEERRLFFVGVSRARHKVFISHVSHYQNKDVKPSEFLKEGMLSQKKTDKK